MHGEDFETFNTYSGVPNTEDRKYIAEQTAKATKKAEDYKKKRQAEAAVECQKLWDSLPTVGESKYLDRKKIGDEPWLGVRYETNGAIYIPIKDETGALTSLQEILPNGDKKFYPGGRIKGCYHVLGNTANTDIIYFAEGLATAASIHLATGKPVVIAFNAHALKVVGESWRKRSTADFVFCGDDDKTNEHNTGRVACEAAAKACGGVAIYPKLSGPGSDFNDLHCNEGLEAVTNQLSNIKAMVPVEEKVRSQVVLGEYPDLTDRRKKKGTYENFVELCRRLQTTIRYNVISKEEEIILPGLTCTMDNRLTATHAHLVSWCERVELPYSNIDKYITTLADQNQFNPVATWIEAKQWDGVSRLQSLYDTVTATNNELKEKLMRAWLVSAVAAAYQPDGISAQGVLVFQGAQAMGKTSWFKKLVPSDLKLTADGKSLDPDNKDSVMQVLSKWMVELGELDSTFKANLSKLKAFLTKDRDDLRPPYARKTSSYPRRTVFFGSVNQIEFLKDPTGNRRFWVIECSEINYKHEIDMQQLWAEVRELYQKGENWALGIDDAAALNSSNERFLESDPIEERIRLHFNMGNNEKIAWLTATEVCEKLEVGSITQRETRTASRVLRELSLKPPRVTRKPHTYALPAYGNIKAGDTH